MTSRVPTRLEQFPNEIFFEVFQYFDARTLFQLFYSLNSRFNALITSFHHLSLVYCMQFFCDNQIDYDEHLFPRYVHTLRVGQAMNIDLSQFMNIRSLHLQRPLRRVLTQVNSNILPHLTHLSVSYPGKMVRLIEDALSTTIDIDLMTTLDEWTWMPSLRSLKMSCINTFVFRTVLLSCPNLNEFEFDAFSLEEDFDFPSESHDRLTRLTIHLKDIFWPWNDVFLDRYLACVPHLEQLDVHRTMFSSKITKWLLDYDWLAPLTEDRLIYLHRFCFHLKIIQFPSLIDPRITTILDQIREIFLAKHRQSSRARLIIAHF